MDYREYFAKLLASGGNLKEWIALQGCYLCGQPDDEMGTFGFIPNAETAAKMGVPVGMQRTCIRPLCLKCQGRQDEAEAKILAEYGITTKGKPHEEIK